MMSPLPSFWKTCPFTKPYCPESFCFTGGTGLLYAVLMIILLGAHSCAADTYGPEFRPGPFTPSGFKALPGMDASGLDLSGAEFLGLDLSGADFSGCNLAGAKFLQVKFGKTGACFRSANMTNVLFEEPDISPRCDFTDATINGISYAPLTNLSFLSASQIRSTRSYHLRDLSGCLIFAEHSPRPALRQRMNFDFDHFDLSGCTFAGLDLGACSFREAKITGVRFYDVALTLSQLDKALIDHPSHSSIRGVGAKKHGKILVQPRLLAGITFELMSLQDEELTNADLRGTVFRHVDLSGVNLDGAKIQGCVTERAFSTAQIMATTSYKQGDLSAITFYSYGLEITKLDLRRQNLQQTVWNGFDFDGVRLDDAVITGADFRPSRRTAPSPVQLQSTWNFKNRRMDDVQLSASPMSQGNAVRRVPNK